MGSVAKITVLVQENIKNDSVELKPAGNGELSSLQANVVFGDNVSLVPLTTTVEGSDKKVTLVFREITNHKQALKQAVCVGAIIGDDKFDGKTKSILDFTYKSVKEVTEYNFGGQIGAGIYTIVKHLRYTTENGKTTEEILDSVDSPSEWKDGDLMHFNIAWTVEGDKGSTSGNYEVFVDKQGFHIKEAVGSLPLNVRITEEGEFETDNSGKLKADQYKDLGDTLIYTLTVTSKEVADKSITGTLTFNRQKQQNEDTTSKDYNYEATEYKITPYINDHEFPEWQDGDNMHFTIAWTVEGNQKSTSGTYSVLVDNQGFHINDAIGSLPLAVHLTKDGEIAADHGDDELTKDEYEDYGNNVTYLFNFTSKERPKKDGASARAFTRQE